MVLLCFVVQARQNKRERSEATTHLLPKRRLVLSPLDCLTALVWVLVSKAELYKYLCISVNPVVV